MSGPGLGPAKLTLGPVLFNWPAEQWRDFYFRIADEAPVDVVYLGEVVCSKRWPFFAPHVAEVAERLQRAGKEVVHSTLALIMERRELEEVRETASAGGALVEANDIACAAMLDGRAHVIGPFVNVYNEGTVAYLGSMGAVRVVLPAELSGAALEVLAAAPGLPALEVQAFGRLPLAISARCYHARRRGLTKDSCLYVCAEDPDGMEVRTLDGQAFLAANGTQTLSHAVCSLLGEVGALAEIGIGHFRLWPHAVDMAAVAAVFRAVLDGDEAPEAGAARLALLADLAPFANGFYYGVEGHKLMPVAAPTAE